MYRISAVSILILAVLSLYPSRLQAAFSPKTFFPQQGEAASSTVAQVQSETNSSVIRALLVEARSEFNKIDAPGGLSTGAPPGTPKYDLVRRRLLLRLIATNYDRILSELKRSEILSGKRAGLNSNIRAEITGNSSPPYSILIVERLRERLQGAQFNVRQTEISLESTAAKKTRAEDQLKSLESRERALLEAVENEASSAKAATIEWQKLLVNLQRKLLSTELALLRLIQKNSEEDLAINRKELSYLGDALNEVSKNSRFSESDLNTIKNELEERRSAYEKELEQALTETESLQNSLEKRVPDLPAAKKSRQRESTETLQSEATRNEQLKNLLVQENLENSILKSELLQDSLELNRLELVIWELRYASEVLKDAESASRITRMIPQALMTLDKEEELVTLKLTMTVQKLNELESELALPETASNHNSFSRLISLYTSREKLLLSKIKVVSAAKHIFTRLGDNYSERTDKAIKTAKLNSWKSSVIGIWSYELFATEDVYTVDGKEIKGKRGVTVGKVVSAFALLIIGFLISSKSTKVFVRFAVHRYQLPEGGALLARRWLMALFFIILLFTSLNLVRIPLTVFAFLGGAIVLGIGFGIQDLMKNLMSGLTLLAEQPFHIGDFIDVDGVRGRVTSIGIRSSTIFDNTGIETHVPNSMFVEKKVTNWTYSSNNVRSSISVGVAYGSDIAAVKARLLQAASSNPDVLKSPEPLVTLDDFGANALVFGLYYWIAFDKMIDPRVISSDIRTSIEAFLSEEGIVIAFPQTDIHIDSNKPLQIEVVAAESRHNGTSEQELRDGRSTPAVG
ncbi:MAG: mechanosensitive ion channel domain-containing protein [Desulfuromonadaceae bacterium]